MAGAQSATSLGRRIRCEISFGQYNPWIRQVVSGYFNLHHAGVVDLTVRTSQAPHGLPALVEAIIDGQTRVVYDMYDGYNLFLETKDPARSFDEVLDGCDLWFKSNCLASKNAALRNRDKVRALGLGSGYFGSCRNPYDVGLVPLNPRQAARSLVGVSDCISSHTRQNSRHMWPDQYELGPAPGDGRVLFIARAWDPDAPEVENDQVRQERVEINAFRAGVIREGRRVLGNRFIGGLQRDDYAARYYPDCIYDGPEAINRWVYLKTLKRISVGIASAGLHGAPGGKLAEYVAASRGIVTTPLMATLPGEFTTGVNYLESATPEESIDACVALLGDPKRLSAMMRANHAYYAAFVRPSALVLRTIQEALHEVPRSIDERE